MPTIPGGVPTPLGLVTVAATGTPVKLTANFTDAEDIDNRLTNRIAARSIFVQAINANTQKIYVGKQNMVIATGVGVLAELSKGEFWSINANDGINLFNILDFRIDADVNGEKARVSFTRQ